MRLTKQPVPLLSQMERVTLADLQERFQGRITVSGIQDEGNFVFVYPGMNSFGGRMNLNFSGRNNMIYIDQNAPVEGEISFPANNAKAWILGGADHLRLSAGVYEGAQFIWGFGSNSFGVRAWVFDHTSLHIGGDSLFSEGVTIRTSDHHSIIDLESMRQVNFPSDIMIGKHVWVAADVSIGKGVSIGDGSIVGAKAFVTKSIGSCEAWVGTPAKKVRDNCSWVGSHPALDNVGPYLKSVLSL
ncbi:MAG: acyltransferase [Komagataeibacter hansenii]|uniref:Acyltransferase n=1 Tax=Novacetimonas hansenii TaxID=436 RepID=A0AAW5ESK8_NOVHA|nr:acyltransferase [Novacetimonas hansenii]MBL7237816.1 acyltransferase [Novacetimonas hansenii]MCJ8353786.1 acyltransferase [Novacetimonas hansenii]